MLATVITFLIYLCIFALIVYLVLWVVRDILGIPIPERVIQILCDIALVDSNPYKGDTDEAKVVELNAFSSSGLYACDTYKIVEAVSRAAAKEHLGELEDA